MSYKVYTKGNLFYVVDNDTSKEIVALKKDVLIDRDLTSSTLYLFKGIDGFNSNNKIDLDDIQDESGTPYIDDDWQRFRQNETGDADADILLSLGSIDDELVDVNTNLVNIENYLNDNLILQKTGTASLSAVSINNTSSFIAGNSPTRKKIIIFNEGPYPLYVKFGLTATTSDYSILLGIMEGWEETVYTGDINGISTNASPTSVKITIL
jgi:hypothetical protein